jgi:MFS family permease
MYHDRKKPTASMIDTYTPGVVKPSTAMVAEHESDNLVVVLTGRGCLGFLESRWFLFLFNLLVSLLSAGVVYGFASIESLLVNSMTEAQLGLAFTVGSWSTQSACFFTGIARDKFGNRSVCIVSLLCATGGAIGLALFDETNPRALTGAIFVLGFGSGTMVCLLPVAELFPGFESSIIVTFTGIYQISGLVFFVLMKISENRLWPFLGYAILLVIVTFVSYFSIPKGVHYTDHITMDVGTKSNTQQSNSAGPAVQEETALPQVDEEQATEDAEPRGGFFEKYPVMRRVLDIEFLALCCWLGIMLTSFNYYVACIFFQLEEKGDITGKYGEIYLYFYGGVALLAPVAGMLPDRLGHGISEAISSVCFAMAFFILGSNDISLNGQIAGFFCFSLGGMLIFGYFGAHVGGRFGYTYFGTLLGLGPLIAAVVANLQYPLINASANGYSRTVNFALGGIILALSLPYSAWIVSLEYRDGSLSFLMPKRVEEVEADEEEPAADAEVTDQAVNADIAAEKNPECVVVIRA